MRGKLMFEIDNYGNAGITPADAGKTNTFTACKPNC